MFDLADDEILSLTKEHVFFTWSAQARVKPIAVKRASGVHFWDTDGKQFLDFNSMTMCVNIGHGDERVIRAMQEQAAELSYAAPGMTTKIRALASKAVAEITPQQALTKVLFTLGGGGCERERHQAGAWVHRQAQDIDALPFLSWRNCRSHGGNR